MTEHVYHTSIRWTGNRGQGTRSYTSYDRDFVLAAGGKADIAGSADPAFRGDRGRWNPEELLVGALSTCHQLWYLHLCASAGVVVLTYADDAEGFMEEQADGAGQFTRIVLRPVVGVAPGTDLERARLLHDEASRMCFVERTLRCAIIHEPTIRIEA